MTANVRGRDLGSFVGEVREATARDATLVFTGVPLALTGGIVSSKLLTLLVLPALYRVFHSKKMSM